MSADNWNTCPNCFHLAMNEFVSRSNNVNAKYGKIPVEEFDQLRAELEAPSQDDFYSFREDYEFYGADSGTLEVSYRGGCSVCGLEHSFSASQEFWSPE